MSGPAPTRLRPFAVVENTVVVLAMAGVTLLPLLEIVLRRFSTGIPGSAPFARNLTMWVGLLGAAIAAREGKLLTLATGEFIPKGRVGNVARAIAAAAGAAISTAFAVGALTLVQSDREAGTTIAKGVPLWAAEAVMPAAFALIALRLVRHAPGRNGKIVGGLAILAGFWIGWKPEMLADLPTWPFIAAMLAVGVLGAPIFALLGGIALFGFLTGGDTPTVLMIKAHEELASPALAAIPLFTFAGFLLAEGRSSERLLRLFRALVGWAPGGTALAAASLCAFFTLLTGGSGVTILAIGGLLLPALVADGYREQFSIGLLTASGSLGLLFPLSVPLMLYAIVAQQVEMADLFIGGLLPGLLMLGLVSALGVRASITGGTTRTPFRACETVAALWEAKWELLLPIVVMTVILRGWANPVESAAVAALFAFIVQRFIHRDIPTFRALLHVVSDCVSLVGGVMIILAVAVGLTHYLINQQLFSQMLEWTTTHIHDRWKFLLCLNAFLLIVGTLMDIFSATVVVVPLLVQFAAPFNISLVHLGIIFVANLELGFLHPPLGLNLLLASYRFKKPVLQVTRATLPMLGILAGGVLLITYWEGLTMGILHWLGRG